MSDHSSSSPEITFHPEHTGGTKRIWNIFWVLSILTVAELALGYWMYFMHKGDPNPAWILAIKGIVCILTLAKAYYIVSVFMHLGDEIRNMIMTIVVPLALFIWFIIAFLWDGTSWKNMKNTDAGSREYKVEKVQKPAAVEKGAKH
jgi:cytochrome c oxidase subunit IV